MIRTVHTDITRARHFANPVNLVGVMGAGLARQVANRWPACVESYRVACRDRILRPGTVLTWRRPDGGIIFQAPTKHHWRDPSDVDLVRQTIDALFAQADRLKLAELHLPALGCGLGGLSWQGQVEPLVSAAAGCRPKLQTVIHLQSRQP